MHAYYIILLVNRRIIFIILETPFYIIIYYVRRDIKDLQSFLENSTSYINLADTIRRYCYTYAHPNQADESEIERGYNGFDSYLLRLPASFPLLPNGRHAPPGHAIVHAE